MSVTYHLVPSLTAKQPQITNNISTHITPHQIDNDNDVTRARNKEWKTGKNLLNEQCYLQNTLAHSTIGILLTLLLFWASLYVLIGDAIMPQSDLFKLLSLILCSYTCGMVFQTISLPHVAGMFLIGSAFRSLDCFNLSANYGYATVILRLVAISVTLTKGGLGLNLNTVIKYRWTVLRYSLILSTGEAIVFAILARYVLNFPWLWAFLFGYVICAMSSGPGLNVLTKLKSKGSYDNRVMQTILENSSYIDNVYSIAAFTICMNAATNSKDGELLVKICYGVVDVVVAVLIAIPLGLIAAYFPHKDDAYFIPKRCIFAITNGTCTYFGCKIIGFPCGGAVACFVAAATAAFCWKHQGWSISYNPVLKFQSKLWSLLMEPLLFGLVGTEVDLRLLELREIAIALGLFTVIILVRAALGMFLLSADHYTLKEKIFIVLSWMPKATVQAALSPQTKDILRRQGDAVSEVELEMGQTIIVYSVLVVIFVTTISSLTIKLSSYKLLTKKMHKVTSASEAAA